MDDDLWRMDVTWAWFALREAWGADTSSDPDGWTAANPSWGQCAVTALVLQDRFGGVLRRVEVSRITGEKVSHYFLEVEDDHEFTVLDPTAEQFELQGWLYPEFGPVETRTREYVLSFPETHRRYLLLRDRYLLARDRLAADRRWTATATV